MRCDGYSNDIYFFVRGTPTMDIYTHSLHDALPISRAAAHVHGRRHPRVPRRRRAARTDRKSTRLNSSHVEISYAVLCLTKKTRSIFSLRSTKNAAPDTTPSGTSCVGAQSRTAASHT